MEGSAGSTVARGLTWTLLGGWLSAAVQLATTMVLARLLRPEDFGLMAMALTLTVIVTQFRQVGLSQAVVQYDRLEWIHVNGLFWINVAAGVLLAGVVALSGLLLADFYGEPQLVWLCLVLGAGFVVSGVSVQHGALLNRAMRFRAIALRNAVASTLASASAIAAALLGAGAWALVVQNVAALFFATVIMWIAVPWRPTRPRGLRASLPLVRFGAHVTVANLFHTLSRQADNIIIGRVLDAGALGLYSRAYGLLMLPLRQLKNPVAAVMVPTLSALKHDPRRYREAYRRSVSGLAHLGMPVVVVLAVTAVEVVDVALGDQWLAAAPVFQLLAAASFVQLVSTTTGWIYVSTGRGSAYAGWAAVSGILTVASFAVGIRWGVAGVATAYTVGQVLLLVPGFVVACRNTPVAFADPLLAMVRPVAVSVVVGGASFWLREQLVGHASVVVLLLVLAAATGTWATIMLVWPGARREVLGLVRAMRSRRRQQEARAEAAGASR